MKNTWSGLVAVVLSGIFGCGPQAEEQTVGMTVGGDANPRLDQVVFLIVNGESLTAEQVKEFVLLQERLSVLSGNPIKPEQFTNWANRVAMTSVGSMAQTMLFRQECDRLQVTAAPEDVKAAADRFRKGLGVDTMPLEELAERFGDRRAAFEKAVAEAAKFMAYERVHLSVDVSEEMIDQFYQFKTNDIAQAKAIDKMAHDNADKAYRRLQAGESWEIVASACSEDKLENPANKRFESQWTLVGADAMGMADLVPLLPTMKPGDYTKPMEHRDGVIIVRLVEKIQDHYILARILFRMARPVRVPATRLEAAGIIRNQIVTSSRARLLQRLEAEAKFDYPMGERFKFLIWDDGSVAKEEKAEPTARTAALAEPTEKVK